MPVSLSAVASLARASTAVPSVIALTHGGDPPSKRKSYSQAMPPPRTAARLIASSSSAAIAVHLCWLARPFAAPNVPSHWISIPCPG